MMRLIVCSLMALSLFAGATAGARADAGAAWKAYRAGHYAEALKALGREAAAGDAEAAYYLGSLYADGLAVTRDDRMAAQWYRRAAEKGHGGAAFTLGFLYLNGAGEGAGAVAADSGEAVGWLQRAARQGDTAARYWLGQLYLEGRGGDVDRAKAAAWSLMAAEQGHVGAQYNVGLLEGRSESVPARLHAYAWFTLAARHGYPGARENLELLGRELASQEVAAAAHAADDWRPGRALSVAPAGG